VALAIGAFIIILGSPQASREREDAGLLMGSVAALGA
jgi:hypothetical protein